MCSRRFARCAEYTDTVVHFAMHSAIRLQSQAKVDDSTADAEFNVSVFARAGPGDN